MVSGIVELHSFFEKTENLKPGEILQPYGSEMGFLCHVMAMFTWSIRKSSAANILSYIPPSFRSHMPLLE